MGEGGNSWQKDIVINNNSKQEMLQFLRILGAFLSFSAHLTEKKIQLLVLGAHQIDPKKFKFRQKYAESHCYASWENRTAKQADLNTFNCLIIFFKHQFVSNNLLLHLH